MSSLFAPAPEPPTKLGRYRLLSPLAGVHVSPLCFGAMSIGDSKEWANDFGAMNKESSFKLLDAYYEAGGNFIDTASNYQDETSEKFIGEWAEARGIRDQLVIATKYTTLFKRGDDGISQKVNYIGNNSKSLHLSVEASLKKLRTSYIDILYVHWWDWETGIEEVMNSLHHLVAAGKVLYLGISDTPAWVVVKANTYARLMGKTPFVIYQGAWNVMERSFERDIIPMARDEGLALAPWNVLAGGRLRTDAEEQRRLETNERGRSTFVKNENGRMAFHADWMRTENEKKMSAALEKVAKEVGVEHITAVAIAYLLQKTPYVFPIIGGRKVEHLHGNIEALDIVLSPEQIKFLEDTLPFDAGFPTNLFGDGSVRMPWLWTRAAHIDHQPLRQPVRPAKK